MYNGPMAKLKLAERRLNRLITPAYTTRHGAAYMGDSRELLAQLPDASVNLVLTSPPFALLRQKQYGNLDQAAYVDWLEEFAKIVFSKLTEDGSFVLDLGGAYVRGVPVRSLYNFRMLLRLCDTVGFHLAEDFYVGIDADTVIAQDAISKLIPHFEDPLVGAVAGNAKVGNRVNLWTRWQALEYITSQNFERRALDLFNVVTVVPGAIGAWRTAPVKAAGGYPLNTVAEDADLTMSLLEQGLKVVYEDRSLAFTEAPIDAKGLMRQRFRWSFGTLQAVWKHRAAFVRNKAMGLFALPNIVIFQMLLPLVSPFIDLMFVIGVAQFFADRYYHPEAASTASFEKLLAYFLTFMVIDFVTSAVAFSLERKHPSSKGDGWLLFHIWLQRFAYRQVFSLVLFKTLKRAIDGRPFNWDKIARTAKMSKQTEKLLEG